MRKVLHKDKEKSHPLSAISMFVRDLSNSTNCAKHHSTAEELQNSVNVGINYQWDYIQYEISIWVLFLSSYTLYDANMRIQFDVCKHAINNARGPFH